MNLFNLVRLLAGLLVCLLPSIWAVSIGALFAHMHWLESVRGVFPLFLISAVLAYVQLACVDTYVALLTKIKPTTKPVPPSN